MLQYGNLLSAPHILDVPAIRALRYIVLVVRQIFYLFLRNDIDDASRERWKKRSLSNMEKIVMWVCMHVCLWYPKELAGILGVCVCGMA